MTLVNFLIYIYFNDRIAFCLLFSTKLKTVETPMVSKKYDYSPKVVRFRLSAREPSVQILFNITYRLTIL